MEADGKPTEQYLTLQGISKSNKRTEAMRLARCDVCGKSVELKDGVLSVSLRSAREVQDKEEKWKRTHPGPILTVGDVIAFPPSVSWIWHHISCEVEDSSYEIEGDRLDTHEKALHWTLHLMDKNWFRFTDWHSVIERFFPECG